MVLDCLPRTGTSLWKFVDRLFSCYMNISLVEEHTYVGISSIFICYTNISILQEHTCAVRGY
jgi:hypothetical protein